MPGPRRRSLHPSFLASTCPCAGRWGGHGTGGQRGRGPRACSHAQVSAVPTASGNSGHQAHRDPAPQSPELPFGPNSIKLPAVSKEYNHRHLSTRCSPAHGEPLCLQLGSCLQEAFLNVLWAATGLCLVHGSPFSLMSRVLVCKSRRHPCSPSVTPGTAHVQ